MKQQPHNNGEPPRWLDDEKNVARLFYGLCGVTAALVVFDLFYDKHGHFVFEQFPGFHAGYGLAGCVALVLIAKQLRKVLMRGEDYYD